MPWSFAGLFFARLPAVRLTEGLAGMRLYLRAIGYFRADRRLIIAFVAAVAFSIVLGLLQAWPTAVIIDAVFATEPRTDWPHRLFLAPLPHSKLAQIIGVTAIGMILWIVQHFLTLVKNMLQKTFTNRGTMRIRFRAVRKAAGPRPGLSPQQAAGRRDLSRYYRYAGAADRPEHTDRQRVPRLPRWWLWR